MPRITLLLLALAHPLSAAPRLKPEGPPPDPEDARIEALALKYDTLWRTGSPAERDRLDRTRTQAQRLAALTKRELESVGPADEGVVITQLRRMLARDPVLRDQFDICVHCSGCDRVREAAGSR